MLAKSCRQTLHPHIYTYIYTEKLINLIWFDFFLRFLYFLTLSNEYLAVNL
jgi:hypothetical protein